MVQVYWINKLYLQIVFIDINVYIYNFYNNYLIEITLY